MSTWYDHMVGMPTAKPTIDGGDRDADEQAAADGGDTDESAGDEKPHPHWQTRARLAHDRLSGGSD